MFSQRVLLKLAERGLPRQRAYELVQRNAMRAWREGRSFQELLAADEEVAAVLGPGELKECQRRVVSVLCDHGQRLHQTILMRQDSLMDCAATQTCDPRPDLL